MYILITDENRQNILDMCSEKGYPEGFRKMIAEHEGIGSINVSGRMALDFTPWAYPKTGTAICPNCKTKPDTTKFEDSISLAEPISNIFPTIRYSDGSKIASIFF